MRVLRITLIVLVSLLFSGQIFGQILSDDSKWTFEAKKKAGDQYELIVHLKLPEHWHIYSFKPGGDGMLLPPSITFKKNKDVKLTGAVKEAGKLITEVLPGIDGAVNMFKDKVDYIQLATITANTIIKGEYSYQICNDATCLPPTTKSFSIKVGDGGGAADTMTETAGETTAATPAVDSGNTNATTANAGDVPDTTKKTAVAPAKPAKDSKTKLEQMPLPALFAVCFGGGLLSIFTPCIFSMIPITISFFTKRSKTRAQGIKNAVYYSLSIIFIFTILGVLISSIFGETAIYALSSDWRANMFFFILIVIFAVSFLGAFEITLPSSWTSVTDSKAGVSSFTGIFFMALTLVIVSFSCTGPIVGPLLVLASKGGVAGPGVGMFGFSLGLALPFSLFAIFPGLINKMAQSGGWLNQVKVVLGFIELMLALKFLSNADLAMGWRLLDREIFLAIWIVLSVLLGVYLLGKLKLSHDDASPKNMFGQEYVSIFKLFLAIGSFTFAVYLLPGMWGAPLNGVSAFVPPIGTFDAFGAQAAPAESTSEVKPVKYVTEFKPLEPPVVRNTGMVTFFDYDEALAASKKMKKPLMLDFTGITCVNCRKMEAEVWANPQVARRLKEDFVVVSLYCDAMRFMLPVDQQYVSKERNTKIATLGDKNLDLEITKFGTNAMPIYFYVDENGNKLAEEGYSYDPDVQKFVDHLEMVKANYKKTHP